MADNRVANNISTDDEGEFCGREVDTLCIVCYTLTLIPTSSSL